mgnify:CR=1 FL=1
MPTEPRRRRGRPSLGERLDAGPSDRRWRMIAGARSRTLGPYRPLTQAERADSLLETPSVERPKTRGDCLPGGSNEQRPCPCASCKYHLSIDVDPVSGGVKVNFPGLDADELRETCALDVAARGGVTLDVVGRLLGITRERIRQIENKAALRLRRSGLEHP